MPENDAEALATTVDQKCKPPEKSPGTSPEEEEETEGESEIEMSRPIDQG